MNPESFVHLHVHSHYSTLDGAVTTDALVARARDLGMRALALTDHGILSGVLEFYRKARRSDPPIKPILGMEGYLAEGSRLEKPADTRSGRSHHLTLLARDLEGYHNLIRLSSIGYVEGFYRKPRIDLEALGRHSAGLIALSGCLSGPVPRALLYGNAADVDRWAAQLREIVGSDNFFIEIMRNGLPEQERLNPMLVEFARRRKTPLVATNDVHYLEAGDALVQEVLLCIQRGQTLSDDRRLHMETDQFYLRSGAEMIRLFEDLPEAVENTALIAERCNLELHFGDYHIPEFRTPPGETPESMLRRLCLEGIRKRYGEPGPEVHSRLEHELAVIGEMGFSSYFLIVWDFIRYAREQDIPVGPGRGSAAGSVVAYSLGITQLDPLRYDLLFERFLNSSRVSMPDIDIDFCVKGREQVVDYVRKKYGHENVCQIVTFGTLAAKAALRDSGRVLGIDLATVDRVAKRIPAVKPPNDHRSLIEIARENDDLLAKMNAEDPRTREWFDISLKIEGLNRHPSTHAAGVVITDRPLTDYVPLCRVRDEINTQFQMSELDSIGLLKMDFLGLKNLTVIDKALDLIERHRQVRLDFAAIPLDDEKTYALLQSGMAKGIFQLESSEGMGHLLVKLRPDCFDDLIALLALYRPGPLGSGMVDTYVERKHGRAPVEMLHESLADILGETYGVIVYQEQVMRIANRMAGFSLNDADKLRKVMSKKNPEVMKRFRDQFVDGSAANGVDRETAGWIFDKIEFFAGYGFNKSHSAAYAMITYRTAYLKANYPLEYMAALLSCDAGNSDKIAEYVEECERMGLKVLGPDFNESTPDFSIAAGAIRFGLNAIKGLGEKAAESIVEAREQAGRFDGVGHLLGLVDLKTVNKLCLETLVKAGAFDSTGMTRAAHFAAIEPLLAAATAEQRDRRLGQANLFGSAARAPGASIPLANLPEWDESFRCACEKEALGFLLSSDPLKRYAPFLRRIAPAGRAVFRGLDEGARVTLAGTIEQFRIATIKKGPNAGKGLALFQVRTLDGRVGCVLFAEETRQYEHLLKEDSVVAVTGTVDRRREEPALRVAQVLALEDAVRQKGRAFLLRLGPADTVGEGLLEEIGQVCRRHPGSFDLLLHFEGTAGAGHTVQAGSRFRVAADVDTLVELERAVGAENVEIR